MADVVNNASLRRLSRRDLLELLVELSEENDRLTARVNELEQQLVDRELHVREAGSLAEVAAEVSGLLLAAQATADLYLQNLPNTPGVADKPNAPAAPTATDANNAPEIRPSGGDTQ